MTSIYRKLALSNIKQNKKISWPYIIASTILTSLFYIMLSIISNPRIDDLRGAAALKQLLSYGQVIVAIFIFIFLFSTYSFLVKSRSKELGLYAVLGIDKNKIIRILSLETIYIYLSSTGLGILLGMVLDKLAYLFLMKLVEGEVKLGFYISSFAVITTILVFGLIYLLILLSTIIKIKMMSIIGLLKDAQKGEKEPRGNIILSLLALVLIGYGYYQSLIIETPLKAIQEFFFAVLAVIAGTYLFFTVFSVFVLKNLKKNKAVYYKTKNFISISNLLFRIKKNAIGLANICILSAMILVTIGSTTSLYVGVQKSIETSAPRDITVNVHRGSQENYIKLKNEYDKIVKSKGTEMKDVIDLAYTTIVGEKFQDGIKFTQPNIDKLDKILTVIIISLDEYNKNTSSSDSLDDGQILFSDLRNNNVPENFRINQLEYKVKRAEKEIEIPDFNANITDTYFLVVKDQKEIDKIKENYVSSLGEGSTPLKGQIFYGFNLVDASKEDEIIKDIESLETLINTKTDNLGLVEDKDGISLVVTSDSRKDLAASINNLYASFLFLGILISSVFLVSQILIMYYRQLSEGYDDRDKFQIMKKVGLEDKEIKSSIKSQVLLIFFAPLVVATIHVTFAYPIIEKMLKLLSFGNTSTFIYAMLATVAVFIVFYFIIYKTTSRLYYNIVSR
ncbi:MULTISPECIES: FtsX-like permease family protein [unclassified Gemella]|uniref:FtsX-like permease family protein n=1 Tax=unclassified Gemella TaxID=2624949 RepID=UPI0015D000C1|nr:MULTISPECIES: FtsX-like permease family protein [unclassified Gemella]MBF0710385.1 ABC transporter permease [Gemella sp. GL1.1]NYS27729.1 ABC transporter permease [Gemella sp. GL1]